MRICPDRNGIAVSVIQDGVILSDGTQQFRAVSVFDDRYRKQMLPFLGKYFCGYPPCRTVDFDIGCSFKPRDSKRVQCQVIVWINAILDKAVLDVSDDILDLTLCLRIGAAAHIYPESAFLTEFLELRCVDDIAVVFGNADDTILIEYQLTGHSSEIFETFPQRRDQVDSAKRSALKPYELVA